MINVKKFPFDNIPVTIMFRDDFWFGHSHASLLIQKAGQFLYAAIPGILMMWGRKGDIYLQVTHIPNKDYVLVDNHSRYLFSPQKMVNKLAGGQCYLS